jgi:hypothetical protein
MWLKNSIVRNLWMEKGDPKNQRPSLLKYVFMCGLFMYVCVCLSVCF